MSTPQIVFVTALAVGLFLLVVELIRRHLLREKYALVWVVVCAGLLSVPWLYDLYAFFGRLVGIIEVSSLFFFLSIIGLLLFSLQFSLALSTAFRQRKTLVQRVALLEARLRDLEEAAAGATPSHPAPRP